MTTKRRPDTVQLNIRVTERQKAAWHRAAALNDMKFSRWMRLVLDGAAVLRVEPEHKQAVGQ